MTRLVMITKVKAKDIAKSNDLFRSTIFTSPRHKIVMTPSVHGATDREEILTAVREFKTFNKANDPHKEHDMGELTVNGSKYYFKIDYYDLQMEFGADPYETSDFIRVMTIMSRSEY